MISAADILSDKQGRVTFRYTDGKTHALRTETLPGEDFIWRVIQHVLPRGFHRVRDYGFLHHNARNLLLRVQWLLKVELKPLEAKQRPRCHCSVCGAAMQVIGVIPRRWNQPVRMRTHPPHWRPI